MVICLGGEMFLPWGDLVEWVVCVDWVVDSAGSMDLVVCEG